MPGKHNDHNFYLILEKNEKNEKFLELPDLARKFIEKSFQIFLPPPPQKKNRFKKQTKQAGTCISCEEFW
jgi:hypothetical protein